MAHPDHVEATSKTREALVTRFDGDRDHGGADLVDDGVPATAVGKTSRQEWYEHYSIETKPESQQARATAHQMMLATVNQSSVEVVGREEDECGQRALGEIKR